MPRKARPTSARSTAIATGVITTGATVIITGRTITAMATMPRVVRTATTADLAIMAADPASASASAVAAIAAGRQADETRKPARDAGFFRLAKDRWQRLQFPCCLR